MNNYTPIDDLLKKYKELKYKTGSSSKEFGMPISTTELDEREAPVEIKSSPEEVEKYITPHADTIILPPDLKKIGIKTEEQNLFEEKLNKIKLPISDDRIMEDIKAPPSEAKRWFATILLYILERSHLTLKKVGKKVVRIFKTN